jgi:branched-chain amino acid transport system substrate-binding protein
MNRQTALLGIFIALLLLAGCNGTSNGIAEETIKIGFIGPLTGDTAVVGESALASAQIAIKEINDAGGILGKQVELIIEDGKCRGQDATVAANKLIHIDQVSSIVGGVCSSETIAAAPIAEKAGIVMISPGSSNPSITHAGEYIFRTYPSDSFQGKEAATYLYEKGYRKVAIFTSKVILLSVSKRSSLQPLRPILVRKSSESKRHPQETAISEHNSRG